MKDRITALVKLKGESLLAMMPLDTTQLIVILYRSTHVACDKGKVEGVGS